MIRIETTQGIRTITLDRPEKANALNAAMLEQIAEAAEAAAREHLKVFVLTGVGKVFSAGADLDEARTGLAVSPLWERVSGAVAALPCLTIAALNGTLAGGANGMALACDIRIAVPGAKFFYPVMKLGFLPQPSDPVRMARLIGPARTKMILMGGQKIDAEEALSWGLIDRIVAPDALAETVTSLSLDASAADIGHIAGIKAMIA